MFVDEIQFLVQGGSGGSGCLSFLREKYRPRGGPDGGDGGNGGDVVLVATIHENTLYHLAGRRSFGADKGQPGGPKERTGRRGGDLVLKVPVGTVVLDADRGHTLKDLREPDQPFVAAKGGRGGRGNARFATATNRTPRRADAGQPGEERRLRLSLKLIADVGLVGLPNAGKSTLLSRLSRARPQVADYPFTTLEPHLGIVQASGHRTFVMADLPGLIEGAHEGKGLGDRFLKHVERTRVLLHLVDCGSDGDPVAAFDVVRKELAGYSAALAERPSLTVATKVEDEAAEVRAAALESRVGRPVVRISAVTGDGLAALGSALEPLLFEV
ncbi:MAG: GTPase ObgE [Planctomycetota bacterium]